MTGRRRPGRLDAADTRQRTGARARPPFGRAKAWTSDPVPRKILGCLIGAASLTWGCADRGSEEVLGGAASTGGTGAVASGSAGSRTNGPTDSPGGATANPGERHSQLFDGKGVKLQLGSQRVSHQVEGTFFILEDSIAQGTPVLDSLVHTDFLATTGGDESAAPLSLFTEETRAPCIKGALAVVTWKDGRPCGEADDCAWSELWGGGIGLTVHAAGAPDQPWNSEGGGIQGFEFHTTGSLGGATLRFKVKDQTHPGEDFCTAAEVGLGIGKAKVRFTQLTHRCYGPDQGFATLDRTNIVELQWQLVPDVKSAHQIPEFCLVQLSTF